jgi:hypothetical protein
MVTPRCPACHGFLDSTVYFRLLLQCVYLRNSCNVRAQPLLRSQAVRPWANYRQDYRLLVETARAAGAPVIAANAPKRYVTMAAFKGFAALSAAVLDPNSAGLPPLPPTPQSNGQRWKMAREFLRANTLQPTLPLEPGKCTSHGVSIGPDRPEVCSLSHSSRVYRGAYDGPHLTECLHRGHALWDASMAFAIAKHVCAHPGTTVMHVCGNFHMQEGFGIPEHLQLYAPGARVLTVAAIPADFQQMTEFSVGRSIKDLALDEWVPGTVYTLRELRCLADYVVLTNSSLPRTYDEMQPFGITTPHEPDIARPRRADTGNITGLPQEQYLIWSYLHGLGVPAAQEVGWD